MCFIACNAVHWPDEVCFVFCFFSIKCFYIQLKEAYIHDDDDDDDVRLSCLCSFIHFDPGP